MPTIASIDTDIEGINYSLGIGVPTAAPGSLTTRPAMNSALPARSSWTCELSTMAIS